MLLRRALAVAVLLAAPAAARAQATVDPRQTGPQLPYVRFAITQFVGMVVPSTTGEAHLFAEGETVSITSVRRERGGALLVGAEAEYRFAKQWSAVGGAAVSARGNDAFTYTTNGEAADPLEGRGDRFTFAKLGVSYRIPDPANDVRRFHPGGFISVAPALVHLDREGMSSVNSPAVNVGIAATAPIGRSRRLAFQLGLDDYLTFWDTHKLEAQDALLYATDGPVSVLYDYSTSNLFTLRLGGSFRF
jgi:hypothetical protein